MVDTAIMAATNMVNNTPFTSIGLHRTLLCPSDIINPWRVAGGVPPPEVQEIPKTDLRTLAEARMFMIAKQTKMREILWEDTKTELERYKQGNLRLGRNKRRPLIAAGGVVLTKLGGPPLAWE